MIKRIQKIIATALSVVTIAACNPSSQNKNNKTTSPMPHDIHSFAKPQEVIITHLDLNLTVDFNAKQLKGTATLDIENKTAATQLHLDTKDLSITKIILDDGSETKFNIGKPVKFLGNELVVEIKPITKKVTITYSTSPDAAALQWLQPSQTAGGKHPFLFTQSQAILARTWIPLQDSPGIKFTYSATISCPGELMAVMSADNDTMRHANGIYKFNMPQPIPSYLMALAVGDLDFHAYTPTCGIFAEPPVIAAAAIEFTDMPAMISSAEELYGKYAWGRYDVLVLPPSFPFGGMENPRITFATPTIIAGDKSLVSLIAHELAHSWSGNLVTNATWNDFWLNEGFTVYFETRIMEKIYGKNYADMLTLLSLNELKLTISEMGDTNPDTKLYLDLKGRDPDDGVTDIAYQKGRFFLATIENAVGRQRWDAFLNKYFTAHAFGSIDTKTFLAWLEKELLQNDNNLKQKIKPEVWIYGTGLPDNCPAVTSAELQKVSATIAAYKDGKAPSELKIAEWTTHHWLYFLRNIEEVLTTAKMKQMDEQFHFTQSGNSEILCDWFQLCVKTNYREAFPAMEKFLLSVGRRKFIVPIYKLLMKQNADLAKTVYAKARPGYHAVATATLDEVVK